MSNCFQYMWHLDRCNRLTSRNQHTRQTALPLLRRWGLPPCTGSMTDPARRKYNPHYMPRMSNVYPPNIRNTGLATPRKMVSECYIGAQYLQPPGSPS